MPVRAKPDGQLSNDRWFAYMDAAAMRCPKGHVLYGATGPRAGRCRFTCQHREKGQSGRCGESVLVCGVAEDTVVVIRLEPGEYDRHLSDPDLSTSEVLKRLGLLDLPIVAGSCGEADAA